LASERNVFVTPHGVSREERESRAGHRGGVVWFTGLSGSGKSTLSTELERALFASGFLVYVLDGDNLRHGLNSDLGFRPQERAENIRRVGEVAALFADAGFISIAAFISPYASDRNRARAAAGDRPFIEVYLKTDLATCERRDTKGLYKRARAGEIRDFTGVSAPYEIPDDPDIVLDTGLESVAICTERLLEPVRARFLLPAHQSSQLKHQKR
jgi:bifunctional enzyme CysN/CysC